MSTPPEAPAQVSAEDSPVRTKLAAAAAQAGARRAAPRRRTTARKTGATVSRNERAAKRGKYADRIAPAVVTGATLLSWKNPVAGRVIAMRAEAWAASLDAVAAEDPRVDALLARVSGMFGKGGAWGKFGQETALMVGGVMVASGSAPLTGPAGMVLAMFAGTLVEQATMSVANDLAYREGVDAGEDPDTFKPHPARVAELAANLHQERLDKATARAAKAAPPDGETIEEFDHPADHPDGTVFSRAGW